MEPGRGAKTPQKNGRYFGFRILEQHSISIAKLENEGISPVLYREGSEADLLQLMFLKVGARTQHPCF